jgi:sulfoxide reductase catalytic subunit YedY
MLIKSRSKNPLTENDTTAEGVYAERRSILKAFGLGSFAVGAGGLAPASHAGWLDRLFGGNQDEGLTQAERAELDAINRQEELPEREVTPEAKAITYNNFYEFGVEKTDPARYSQDLNVKPWTLEIGGEVEKPMTVDVWELIHGTQLEERIYRLRCVEAWSMVIPWIGIELNKLLKPTKPTSRAKYVAFQTLYDPEQMPGQASRFKGGAIDFPYREGLRMDEAMHPLTIMAVGMYGKTLPPQNGAPIRLMSPWKYGFKAIKSIVRIDLVEQMPRTTWSMMAPNEYGFYANVNPSVDHPRWSQSSERFIGDGRFPERKPTLPFNGYAEEVAQLYSDMNLKKWY